MTDYIAPDWAENSAENTGSSPNGIQGSYSPSSVAPILRELRGAAKRNFVRSNPIYTTTASGSAYVLTYIAGPVSYARGEVFRVWAHADSAANPTMNINNLGAKALLSARGEPLTAGAIKAGDVLEFTFDGTSFRALSITSHDAKFTGNTTVSSLTVSNASVLSGLTTISGPTYAAGGDYARFIPSDWGTGKPGLFVSKTANSSIWNMNVWDGSAIGGTININTTAFTVNGNTVWHAGNDGAGSALDAGLLGGQLPAYYQNASNLNAGTIADARLPTTMTGKTFNGTVTSSNPFVSTNAYGFRNTSGTYGSILYQDNNALYFLLTNANDQNGGFNSLRPFNIRFSDGLVSMGHGLNVSGGSINLLNGGNLNVGSASYDSTGNIRFRGSMETNYGTYLHQALDARIKNDGGTYSINVSGNADGAARLLRMNGSPTGTGMVFNWSGQGGQPNWLWGGNDGANHYVYNPSNFSVNYANTANNANNLGGVGAGNFAQFSYSSNQSETYFPMGQTLGVYTSNVAQGRREYRAVYLMNNVQYYTLGDGAVTQLTGMWRQCGQVEQNRAIYQRVA